MTKFEKFLQPKFFFILVIVIALFFRFFQLASVPPSPSLDEVSIGYNAYSIMQTGRDEYGTHFPVLLRAYDDFRPALYVYLVIPFVKLLGLTTLAVRLPAAILSILTIIVAYFLLQELLYESKYKKIYALLVTLLLAISPWHIYISRLGHEVNPGLTFVLLGTLFFLKALRTNSFLLLLSSVFFAFSFYTYQSEKVITPVLVLMFCTIFCKKLLQVKKEVFLATILGIVISLPILSPTLSPQGLIRLRGTNVFSANEERFNREAIMYANATKQDNILGKVVHNRRIVAVELFIEGYFSHFNPRWLFTNSSDDRHKIPGLGLMYLWEIPLILLGVILLSKENIGNKFKIFIFGWIFLTPLAAAFTTDTPHVMRIFTMLPMPQILTAFGLLFLFKQIDKSKRLVLVSFFVILIIASSIYLYRQYFFVFPITQSASFQYALSKAIPYVLKNQDKYERIVFSNQDNLYQSYMFFLFYSRYDPALYLNQGGTISGGFAQNHTFGKYEFRPIKNTDKITKALYIVNISDFPADMRILANFTNLDSREAIRVASSQ